MGKKTNIVAILVLLAAVTLLMNHARGESSYFDFPAKRGMVPKYVPGGILYPNFNRAAEINAATIPWEWATGAEIMYSPPSFPGDGHGAFAAFTKATRKKFGFGLGYQTSIYNGNSVSGGFAGMGYGTKKVSFGLSLRKPVIDELNRSVSVDLGTVAKPLPSFDFAFLCRDINNHPVAILGLGSGRYSYLSAEINFLYPLYSVTDSAAAKYRATASSTLKIRRFELGLMTTYSSYESSLHKYPWNYTAATTVWLKKYLGVILEYNSHPSIYSIGIGWYRQPKDPGGLSDFMKARGFK